MRNIQKRNPFRSASKSRLLLAAGALTTLLTTSATAQPDPITPNTHWTPDVSEACAHYLAGNYQNTQSICRQLLRERRSADVRRDAAALIALCYMRGQTRQERTAGRAQLFELAQNHPELLQRPECLLASGIAQRGVLETAGALDHIEQAVTGFIGQNRLDRAAVALTELAQTWANHTEWESTPPRFAIIQPLTPVTAHEVRLNQIESIRRRAAKLPLPPTTAQRIDLIRARYLLDKAEDTESAREILKTLAYNKPLTEPAAEAALLLANLAQQNRDARKAAELYQRIAQTNFPELSRQAADQLQQLQSPQLHLDLPDRAAPNEPIPIRIRSRHVDQLNFEIRHVALADWLERNRGQLIESQLPVTGSVRCAADWQPNPETEHDWWQPPDFPCALPPGAYVAILRGDNLLHKKLILASNLHATLRTGHQYAVLWTTTDDPANLPATAAARFWMFGSYVPTRLELHEGVATFRLPGEAAVFRDKRWVCLVDTGEQLALTRGKLPPDVGDSARSRAVALSCSTIAVEPGETVTFLGAILGHAPDDQANWRLDLADAYEAVVFSNPLELSPAGTFGIQWRADANLADVHLHALVYRDDQVIPNAFGRLPLHVRPRDPVPLAVDCRVPPTLPANALEFQADVEAYYPWAAPAANANYLWGRAILRLPHADDAVPLPLIPGRAKGKLGPDGRARLTVPLTPLFDFDHPAAIGLNVSVVSYDERWQREYVSTIRAEQDAVAWILTKPENLSAGHAARFRLEWVMPRERPVVAVGELDVANKGGEVVASLPLIPSIGGYTTEPWIVPEPGTYTVRAKLTRFGAAPLVAERTIEVATNNEALALPNLSAAATTRGGDVQLRLSGSSDQPLLAVIGTDEPRGATAVRPFGGAREVAVPATGRVHAGDRVTVFARDGDGMVAVAQAAVQPRSGKGLPLRVRGDEAPCAPGGIASVDVECASRGAVSALARLTPEARTGLASLVGGDARVLRDSMVSWIEEGAAALPLVPAPLLEALFAGETLWSGHIPRLRGKTKLDVPLPAEPGRYRLSVLARGADGRLALESVMLDTTGGVELVVDVPRRFTVGDRTVISAVVRNPSDRPRDVALQVAPGVGLGLESAEVRGERVEAVEIGDGTARFTLAGRSRAHWVGDVEAAAVGGGTAEFGLLVGALRQRVSAAYVVGSAESVGDAAVRVERELFLLIPERPALEEDPFAVNPQVAAPTADTRVRWNRSPLRAGEVVSPGQRILVSETFETEGNWRDVTWVQRMPANAFTVAVPDEERMQIGLEAARRPTLLRYRVERLAEGRHRHEYWLVAGRPGACVIPPPEVLVGDVLMEMGLGGEVWSLVVGVE